MTEETQTRRIPVNAPLEADPRQWARRQGFATTADVAIPDRLIEQVIGQDHAVEIVRRAAEQKRNILLIGDPGTGKSMIAKAMAELLPAEAQKDVLVHHNAKNPNMPKVAQVEGGLGRRILEKYERKATRKVLLYRAVEYGIAAGTILFGLVMWLALAQGVLSFLFSVLIGLMFVYFMGQKAPKKELLVPKLLAEHAARPEKAPYVDATGSHAGALLGDVRHDPFQSGGLETPPHARVEEGAIHRAHKGVLFIDEINVLRLPSQQALLTAMQDRQYAIVGQSQSSSGAMIRTEPVPCDFILVAAGNLDAVAPPEQNGAGGMHPALRSRIRGYGYEIHVNALMDDTDANRAKLVQFVAQEVARDGRIPHFDADAVGEVIREAQRRSGRTGKLTLRLRELGGLVRTAGDFASAAGATLVTVEHVRSAKRASRSLEQQIMEKDVEGSLAREGFAVRAGAEVGSAIGVAIVGTGEVGEPAGLVAPVEAAVVPALSRHGGAIVLGPGLKGAHGHGVENVGAVLKILKGDAIADHDIHVDARIAHPHAEAEGIGMAAAVAAVSALESLPVRQDVVLVGEVAVSGALRPVRATLQRLEAAAALGYRRAIVPAAALASLLADEPGLATLEIVACHDLAEVLDAALDATPQAKVALSGRLHVRR
ncbi:MAG: ATP-dependent Lon protease [Thermoplasmata archaeon]|jgi:Lon-like ATP-dependent protease|nr:ATP-dependent Lon protease [Thermoplasmata archaeon]